MSLYHRVATAADILEIRDFEKAKLANSIADEMEREIASWNARWREESLNHYLALGWSFLVRDKEQKSTYSSEGLLLGYFLAQPLLFFDGQTQSLWVEHIEAASQQAHKELCDLAYRMSREKHFQKVIFPNSEALAQSVASLKTAPWAPPTTEVKTTKV